MKTIRKIGLGGGCHWCTEAVFQSLKGVLKVEQGYIASSGNAASFSEAVIVHFDPEIISLKSLLEVHLYTHNSTSQHSFREKYRSAVYFFEKETEAKSREILKELQEEFEETTITRVLPFREFRPSRESLQDYYLTDPDRPFCKRYIHPKLQLLKEKFSRNIKKE